jgi:membrane-associated protease RseP (regulator of RpoE activity)
MWLNLILLLILSGIITYAIVRRSTSQLTTAPVWLLWLVLMAPPLLTGLGFTWLRQVPTVAIAIVTSSLCWLTYWWLLSAGKHPRPMAGQPVQVPSQPIPATEVEEEEVARPISAPLRPIDRDEEASLRTCFPWNVFFLEKFEYRPQAVICRGKLRGNADAAYATIVENVRNIFGDRFLVLFQYSFSTGKPFFAIVPNPQLGEMYVAGNHWYHYTIASLLLLLTAFATTSIGVYLARLGMRFNWQELIEALPTGIPYAAAILGVLGARDIGRWFVAKFYRIDITVPYFIPLPFFPGTFGSLVQFRSLIPNRKAVFDLGFAASMLGAGVSLPLLFWGLTQSAVVKTPTLPSGLFTFNTFDPRFSLLITGLSKLALGDKFGVDRSIVLHPVATAAYVGLFIIAINLLPLRRLDGGYIVQAMFGQKPSVVVSQLGKFVLLLLGLLRWKTSQFISTDLLFLAIVVSLIPPVDEPPLNDVSEVNSPRDLLGVFALALLVAIFFPVPSFLQQWLGV